MELKRILIAMAIVTNLMTVLAIAFHFTHTPAKPQVFQVQPQQVAPVEPEPAPPVVLDVKQMQDLITEADCREIVGWLASDEREGRMSGKKGNKESADYIKAKFESFGLDTKLQQFRIRRMNPGPKNELGDDYTNNIVATLPGETDRQIVIGGHMDHIGYGPQMSTDGITGIHNGADDNASGATTVIELARAFSKGPKPHHTMIFICFSGEEMGLIGSRAYVEKLTNEEIKKIDLMVNYDMVGYLKGKKTIPALGAKAVPSLVDIIGKISNKYEFKVVPASDSSGNSDHASFGRAGVPYVFFFTGLHENYHKVSDDADKIDYIGMVGVARFGVEMISEFDKTLMTNRIYTTFGDGKACLPERGNY